MKKFLVIGNPIQHSLSPELHNFWIKQKKINAIYEKKQLEEKDIPKLINEMRNNKIRGINVTIPYKKLIIKFVDELSKVAKDVQSVNTLYKKNNKIVGDNTDVGGFGKALKHINYNVKGKKVLIPGAGGVVNSIIYSLKKKNAGEITLSNRTRSKAEALQKIFKYIKIVEWGKTSEFDMIINATSIGLKAEDKIEIDYSKHVNKFFYDVIYNPIETHFLKMAKKSKNKVENGKLMFIYQAKLAFELWHNKKIIISDNELDYL